jgi:D-arabinose 1-dehydrogenase-like Zn-dependent alcohol dehydrogenase
MIAPANVLARIPDELSFIEAAPLLCAGITTYNALRHSGARGGDVVAIEGSGGLGIWPFSSPHAWGFIPWPWPRPR